MTMGWGGGGGEWDEKIDMTLKSENKQFLVTTLNRNTCSVVRGLHRFGGS